MRAVWRVLAPCRRAAIGTGRGGAEVTAGISGGGTGKGNAVVLVVTGGGNAAVSVDTGGGGLRVALRILPPRVAAIGIGGGGLRIVGTGGGGTAAAAGT